MEPGDAARNQKVVDFLVNLDHPKFVEILQHVFATKKPYASAEGGETRYFLGVGGRDLEEDTENPGAAGWGAWYVEAVGYIDRDVYPKGYGESHFAQHGRCQTCQTEVSASVKHAICPICGEKVYLT